MYILAAISFSFNFGLTFIPGILSWTTAGDYDLGVVSLVAVIRTLLHIYNIQRDYHSPLFFFSILLCYDINGPVLGRQLVTRCYQFACTMLNYHI